MIIIYIDAYRCVLMVIIRFYVFLAFKKIYRYKVGYGAAFITTSVHHFAGDTNLLLIDKSLKKINKHINRDLKLTVG